MKKIILLLVLMLFLPSTQAVDVEFFSIPDCGPCEDAKDYLSEIVPRMPDVELIIYNESFEDGADFPYFEETAARLGFTTKLVPVVVVGNDFHITYVGDDVDGERIKEMILKNKVAEKNLKEPPIPEETLTLKLFWAIGCPHCEEEMKFLEKISPKYPELVIEKYEVGYNETNQDILIDLSDEIGFEPGSVPITVIGDWYLVGYGTDESHGTQIENAIIQKLGDSEAVIEDSLEVEVPFLGNVDLEEMGVPLSTVVIGLIDGFNPCAFFVLTMLLSFMVYAKSRKRMLLIGLTFVFISGLIYFLFMTAMFSVIRAINEIRTLAIIGGIVALTMAAINLKDFFWFKKGMSLTISDENKSNLFKRMRGLLKAESMLTLLAGTVVLAVVANSYELLCTAGLPLVYGNLLNSQQLDFVTSIFYIAFYNVFYVLPLLAIVLVFVKSLGNRKLSQEEGELLKAISGFMMLGFGIFLLIDPRILQNIVVTSSLILFSVILSVVLSKVKKKYKAKEEPKEEEKVKKKPKAKKKKKNGPAKKSKVQ